MGEVRRGRGSDATATEQTCQVFEEKSTGEHTLHET